jgi:hypothetical protein
MKLTSNNTLYKQMTSQAGATIVGSAAQLQSQCSGEKGRRIMRSKPGQTI